MISLLVVHVGARKRVDVRVEYDAECAYDWNGI